MTTQIIFDACSNRSQYLRAFSNDLELVRVSEVNATEKTVTTLMFTDFPEGEFTPPAPCVLLSCEKTKLGPFPVVKVVWRPFNFKLIDSQSGEVLTSWSLPIPKA